VAAVRKAHHLKETDIPGISSRQIRRIEKGDHPKLETLRKLSQAHGLTVNEYLQEIAANVSQWRSIN
jgi:transcriptional regulator with XRE-family HTH domain